MISDEEREVFYLRHRIEVLEEIEQLLTMRLSAVQETMRSITGWPEWTEQEYAYHRALTEERQAVRDRLPGARIKCQRAMSVAATARANTAKRGGQVTS